MIPVCTAQTVRALDAVVIETLGMPGHVLMELAGRGAADALAARWPDGPVAVLCGPGNNGGDGYVVARWLALWGREVRLWASRAPSTPGAITNAGLCQEMGLRVTQTPTEALDGVAVAVDALLGTGQRSAPRGTIRDGLRALAASPAPTVAMDLPTGLSADTGQKLGTECVQAALTVTFGHHKPGLLCEPGATLCGEVVCVDIGLALAARSRPDLTATAFILEASDIAGWQPARRPSEAKWDRGHVAVLAGGGAAVLAAHGAFRAGAGLVTLLAPRTEWPRLHGLWPEVILAEPDALSPRRHSALVIGPGLGLSAQTAEQVRRLWRDFPGPLLADADALTHLGTAREAPAGVRVITPHSAEAGRLLGKTRAAIEADRFSAVRALVGPRTVALLKGPNTLISGAEGTWAVPVRCSALGTAGSGDVLAGLIGGLLAQGCAPQIAAALGAWRHGHAGLTLQARATASDLLDALR